MLLARTDRTTAANTFHALADPTRIDLVRLLLERELCVCDIVSALGQGQSLISFHLRVLKNAGLVAGRKSGRWVYYSADPAAGTLLRALTRRDTDRGAEARR